MAPKKATARSKLKKGEAAQSTTESKQDKTSTTSDKEPEVVQPAEDKPVPAPSSKQESNSKSKSNTSKKRKSPSSQDQEISSTKKSKPTPKAPRKGTRTSTRTSKPPSSSTTSTTPSPTQLITYLLSPSSLPHAYPSDELSQTKSPKTKIYSYALTLPHTLTPFLHLLTASLLSKPLSHVLGLRSIRTLLNPPFNLTTPTAITTAGEHRVWEALEQARTQHRQKSAAYVFQMAKLCVGSQSSEDDGGGGGGGESWGEGLEELRKLAGDGNREAVMKEIKKRVKGMGGTGAEVFLRRVQCCEGWEGCWPFADGKALRAMRELGVGDVEDAVGLRGVVEEVVKGLGMGNMGLQSWDERGRDVSEEQKLRIAFVVVLERALGASLEGNLDQVRKAAAAEL